MIDLLYIRHPDPAFHNRQLEALASLNEPEKSKIALFFRLGNAAMHYYNTGDQPSVEDYQDWLSGLPAGIQDDMRKKGYEGCKTIVSLQRHALERVEIGMNEFMRKILNDEDYQIWTNSRQNEVEN